MRTSSGSRFVAALTVLVIGQALGGSPATAQTGGGANNVVQVISTTEEPFRFRAGIQVAPYGGDSAQSTNLARADARNCTGCRSQAAALQAVFLTSGPSTVQVTNAAVATNTNCTSCVSYAYAYQYVITTSGPVSLSAEGKRRVASISREADTLVAQQLPLDELNARLQELAAQLRSVVDSELRARGITATARESLHRDLAS
jgi:hypothetical protein